MADARFYSIFYEELFRRYKNWSDLPGKWRENKDKSAQWIGEQIDSLRGVQPDSTPKVLSIGSGVGYMENTLLHQRPKIELYVNEPSTVGMKWIRKLLPADRIFIGNPTTSIPADITFDLIYLSAVDYSIPTKELARLMDFLTAQLSPHGQLLCISASLLQEDTYVGALVNSMKNIIRGMLHYMGIRRQQFWGWRRTQKEYRHIFSQARLRSITDGTLNDGFDSYWIRGFAPNEELSETDASK